MSSDKDARIAELQALLREWFSKHGTVTREGQRDEYFYCHECKKSAGRRELIKHTDECLYIRTKKAIR